MEIDIIVVAPPFVTWLQQKPDDKDIKREKHNFGLGRHEHDVEVR